MFFVCVTVGLVFLASKYRGNVIRSVKNFCNNITNNSNDSASKPIVENNELPLDKIILADSPEKCDYAVQRIRCDLSNGVLGFDCEWVNEGPVALLQLATFNGVCALFRIGKIGYVPAKLKELLANKCILKVGVAPFEDGRKLTSDYGCRVFGSVDLRTLAHRLGVPAPKSLAALALEYLGVEMEKIVEVRCGDWNADILTDRQATYAACDAIASVFIYHKIRERAKLQRSFWQNFIIRAKSAWSATSDATRGGGRFDELPEEIIDTRYKAPSEKGDSDAKRGKSTPKNVRAGGGNGGLVGAATDQRKNNAAAVPAATRKEPLYHNCYLEAPDGEILCTCDRKKADWYVSRKLGVTVQEEPFTVRLNFEPSGRAFGQVGQYYTQVKINQCVVCGSMDNFIKKNVVPREYRKYFPLVMKAHQSHDVLLLCPNCHEMSNRSDLELRRHLADLCDAPLARIPTQCHRRAEESVSSQSQDPREWRNFLSAVKALGRDGSGEEMPASISLPRARQQLDAPILEFTGQPDTKPRLMLHQRSRDKQRPPVVTQLSPPARFQSHGLKVVRYFEERKGEGGGLVELERMWRQHFLDTMRPRFLPNLWSVSHNQERLVIRQTQKRIEPQDAKLAGLTESNCPG